MKSFTLLNLMGFLALNILFSSCGNNGVLGKKKEEDKDKDRDNTTVIYDSSFQNQDTLQLNYTGGNVVANQNFNVSLTNTTNVNIRFSSNWSTNVYSTVPGNFVSTTCSTNLGPNQSCQLTYVITNTWNLISGSLIVNYQPNTGGVIQSTVNIPFNSNSVGGGNNGGATTVSVSIKYNEPGNTLLVTGVHSADNCRTANVYIDNQASNGVPAQVEGGEFACYFQGPDVNKPSKLYGENSPTDDPITSELGSSGCPVGWNSFKGTDGTSGEPIIKTETTFYKSVSGWNILNWDPTYQYGQVTGENWSDSQPFGYACLGNNLCLTNNQYSEVYARVTGVLCY